MPMWVPPPGLTLVELVAADEQAERWTARRSDGTEVSLTRVPVRPAAVAAAVTAVRRVVAIAGTAGSPHLEPVLDVRPDHDSVLVVGAVPVARTLAGLLVPGPPLPAGALVTVLAPVAGALAALHERGIAHGRLAAPDVLLTPEGRPVLAVPGLPAALALATAAPPAGEDPPASAAGDVAALGRLARDLLALVGPDRPAALDEVVAACLQPDPARRPGAAAVAERLLEACPAQPVRRPGDRPAPSEQPEPSEPAAETLPGRAGRHAERPLAERRLARLRRRALVAAAAAGAVAAAIAAGGVWGRHTGVTPARPAPVHLVPGRATAPLIPAATTAPASVAPTRTAAELYWHDVVTGLVRQRAAALRTGRSALLAAVYAPASTLTGTDRGRLDRLRGDRLQVRGRRETVGRVRVVVAESGRVRLRFADTVSAYRLVDATGRTVARMPAMARRVLLLTLVRAGGAWRIAAVSAQPTRAASAASMSS